MSRDTVRLLGVKFDKANNKEAFARFISLLNLGRFSMIFTPTPEMVMIAQEDEVYRNILVEGDLIIPDGLGIIYASNLKGLGLKERVPGIELMENILNHCNNARKSIYLLGGKPGVAAKAAVNITEKYTNIKIAGFNQGYFNEEEEFSILDDINELKPDVLFVALGSPKQEKWIFSHRKILNCKVAMGIGGNLDIWAGVARRAPEFITNMKLEWLYRFVMNPKRFKRFWAIPKFLIKVMFS